MKLNKTTIAVTLLSCVVFAGVFTYTTAHLPQPETPKVAETIAAPAADTVNSGQVLAVSVIEATAGQYATHIEGYGEVKSRYELSLTAEVSGRILSLGDGLESGKLVKKGEVLARLDQTKYLQSVSEARSDQASAQLDLLEEERQGEQARMEWEHSGMTGKPDSPLVLREPQLVQAKTELQNAEQALIKAQHDLNNTIIKAPFNALVVSRNVQPGSYLQEGSEVATLYSTDMVEIAIPLSQAQWLNLPQWDNVELAKNPKKWPVKLSNHQASWDGYVTRVEQHLDSSSRQRSLIVAVSQPLNLVHPLYPGTFVTASIQGAPLKNSWRLPQSAISQQGELWYVDEQGELAKTKVEEQFQQGDVVYVKPFTDNVTKIVKRPLSSYKVGTRVQVIEETK